MIIEMVIFYYVNDDFSLSRWWFFAKRMMIFHHVTNNNMVKIIICLVKNHYLMIKNYHLHDDEWSNFSRLRRPIRIGITILQYFTVHSCEIYNPHMWRRDDHHRVKNLIFEQEKKRFVWFIFFTFVFTNLFQFSQ